MIISLPCQSFGYGLSPMNLSIEPVGKGATGSFFLENKTDDVVPVEASVVRRTLDIIGKEETGPLKPSDKFVIYPPMITLKPHEKRTVRVLYAGPSDVPIEQTFRFFATQLPVSNYQKDKNKNVLNILMRYGASLYVARTDAAPNVIISNIQYVDGKDPKIELTFENTGTAHQNLINYNLKITTSGNNSYVIPWDQVKTMVGPLNVFAKQKRRVIIPFKLGTSKEFVKGEIQFLE